MATIVNRRFGLIQATALNMSNMIGIGPFITIPLLMTALGGPQAMLGWIVALAIVICDGQAPQAPRHPRHPNTRAPIRPCGNRIHPIVNP